MRSEQPHTAPLILGFDTSAAHCAAALLQGDRVLVQRLETMAKGQAERLMPFLEELLNEAGLGWRDLDAVAVGIGPGNFTGIRISVSAARGLALGLDVPAVGVSGLEAQAHGLGSCGPDAAPVVSSLDGRRDMLYLQRFAPSAPRWNTEPPQICTLDTLPDLQIGGSHDGGPICVGHASAEIADRIGGQSVTPAMPLAEAIARIAAGRWQDSDLLPPAPLYLREADAAPSRDLPPALIDG